MKYLQDEWAHLYHKHHENLKQKVYTGKIFTFLIKLDK